MIRTLNLKSRKSFPILFIKNVFNAQENDTTLFSLILYKANYWHPPGDRKQKISCLHRTAFLNVKYLFLNRILSKKVFPKKSV